MHLQKSPNMHSLSSFVYLRIFLFNSEDSSRIPPGIAARSKILPLMSKEIGCLQGELSRVGDRLFTFVRNTFTLIRQIDNENASLAEMVASAQTRLEKSSLQLETQSAQLARIAESAEGVPAERLNKLLVNSL